MPLGEQTFDDDSRLQAVEFCFNAADSPYVKSVVKVDQSAAALRHNIELRDRLTVSGARVKNDQRKRYAARENGNAHKLVLQPHVCKTTVVIANCAALVKFTRTKRLCHLQ